MFPITFLLDFEIEISCIFLEQTPIFRSPTCNEWIKGIPGFN